ncbi:pseudouridylate synthase [Corynebacterium heidelbergense]|uniref:RNA pseudouridylate synthase n=1 Tax=Corynebacterium heidelbergense TaxID=2055947 RepID=A0A364V9I9_9CORY|nr:pseudouridylate synthase [Corynebacterium heidelbergense]
MKPLPIRAGLNPTRACLHADSAEPVSALQFVSRLIHEQRHRHPDDDDAAIEQRFADGLVRDDHGRPFAPSDLLRPGQFVNFYRRPAIEREVPGVIPVLHQDDHLVVVDKPPFLATMPRGQHIAQTATVKLRNQLGNPELSPAHRLDRLTSGVLMFTARRQVRGLYQAMFERRIPEKIYQARTPIPPASHHHPIAQFADWQTWPDPTPETPWTLSHRMIKIRGRLAAHLEVDGPPNADTQVLGVRETQYAGQAALEWVLRPLTGKTHQLRLALRTLGLPIFNDVLYEHLTHTALYDPQAALPSPPTVEDEDFSRPLQLCASQLRFTDPITGRTRVFTSRRSGEDAPQR